MATTYTPVLGTSNVRGSSRQTRTNPTRTSKTNGSNLRQNSLVSAQPPSVQGGPEPHGFYPAIQHFTDAIAALPREYRRHTSLLKEVDAKAWQPEEHLQILLSQCLADQPTLNLPTPAISYSAAPSVTNPADDIAQLSAVDGVAAGPPADAASQISSASSTSIQRRQLFGALRHNLCQIMITMDEKNHVINNANDELSTHIRRLDNVWPHIADEISEEARLGSLKHWALTDINPMKKGVTTTSSRRDANLAIIHDNEVAQRSESRREAVAAKSKQRLNRQTQVESGTEAVKNPKKKALAREDRANDSASDVAGLGISTGKGKKGAKGANVGLAALEKTLTAVLGGRAMSREPSQQDGSKKRKAPAGGAAVARKRVNAAADSPKLASSPLASTFPKDAYKRSPALAAARPVSARARQNSTQAESSRAKTSTTGRTTTGNGSTTKNAGSGSKTPLDKKLDDPRFNPVLDAIEAQNQQLGKLDTAASKTVAKAQQIAERRASKTRDADNASSKGANSPRPSNLDIERSSARGRASKTSTPVVGTFSEAEASLGNTTTANGSNNSTGTSSLAAAAAAAAAAKAKRPARPRPKYDGLHDSLSPKGLPPKRLHKNNGSVTTLPGPGSQGSSGPTRLKEETSMDSRLQRTNSGNTAASRSGNATPVDGDGGGSEEEGGDEDGGAADGVTSHPRQSSQQRGPRSRGRSAQNSRKGTANGGGRGSRGRIAGTGFSAAEWENEVDEAGNLLEGPAGGLDKAGNIAAADQDLDMLDADADADADADQDAAGGDANADAEAEIDPDETAELLDDSNNNINAAADSANNTLLNSAATLAQADLDAEDEADVEDLENQSELEEEEEEEEEDDEERYCYCQMGSYGEMVACDSKDCPREWFHLECIGLKSVPKSAKWYCEECRRRIGG